MGWLKTRGKICIFRNSRTPLVTDNNTWAFFEKYSVSVQLIDLIFYQNHVWWKTVINIMSHSERPLSLSLSDLSFHWFSFAPISCFPNCPMCTGTSHICHSSLSVFICPLILLLSTAVYILIHLKSPHTDKDEDVRVNRYPVGSPHRWLVIQSLRRSLQGRSRFVRSMTECAVKEASRGSSQYQYSAHISSRRTHKPDTRSTDTVVVKGLGAGILYGSPCLSLCWLPRSSVGTSNPSHLLHLSHKQHREQFEFYGLARRSALLVGRSITLV